MNYGLVLISPMVLVRLLSDEDFGRYREFLVYVTLLSGIAAFGINSSLLRFVPESPQFTWRFVNQSVAMTFVGSILVTGSMLILNALLAGNLIPEFAVPIALYVLLSVNLDFWEFLWLAQKRSSAVLRYTTARLVARIIVVTVTAALTKDIATIVWALVWLEAARVTLSALAWRGKTGATSREQRSWRSGWLEGWREQLAYCLPFGAALVAVTVGKSIAPLFVAKALGTAALAQFAIGTYLQPVITVIRNSLSDVVLPEMAAQSSGSQGGDRLRLWRRSTVVTALFLFSATVLLAKFADVLIVTLFSETYRPAVLIFQIYLLVFFRDTLDFGIPLRAITRNAPILHSNLLLIGVQVPLLLAMVPAWGLVGAVTAIVISKFIEGAYLASRLAHAYGISMRALAPWKDLFKILVAALLSAVVLYGDFWTDHLGILGLVPAGAIYMAVFVLLLSRLNIPEVDLLVDKLRAVPSLALRRPH
jgi:O-antigen/teichoic acid export membrane protein